MAPQRQKGTASKGQIPIKKKADLPIRTKQGAVPIKTAEWASERIVDSTAEKAFQEAQKATITAAQKSSHAAATATTDQGRFAILIGYGSNIDEERWQNPNG